MRGSVEAKRTHRWWNVERVGERSVQWMLEILEVVAAAGGVQKGFVSASGGWRWNRLGVIVNLRVESLKAVSHMGLERMVSMGFVGGFVRKSELRLRTGWESRVCFACGSRRFGNARSCAVVMVEGGKGDEGEKDMEEAAIFEEAKMLIRNGGSEGVRKALLYSRQVSPSKGLELLLYLLDGCENEIIEATATVMLGQVGRNDPMTMDCCVEELSRRLSSGDSAYGVRSAAATGLGELRHRGSFEALRRAYFEDTEWAVRYAVLTAMGNLGDERAVPMLIDALKSPVGMLVHSAISALGEIGDPQCVKHLLKLTDRNDDDMMTQQSLALALGRFLDEPGVVDTLRELARSDNPLISDTAEEALHSGGFDIPLASTGQDKKDELGFTLRDMLEQSFNQTFAPKEESQTYIDSQIQSEVDQLSEVRQAEYRELCEQLKSASDDERAIAAIRLRSFSKILKESAVAEADALRDSSQRVRASVLNLIAHNPNTLAAVLLGDPDQNVRASACSALVECGEVEAGVSALMVAFENDADWIVRVSAAIALGNYATKDRRTFDILVKSLVLKDGFSYIPGLAEPEARVVQTHVITSLGFVGSTDALNAFETMSTCKESKIRLRVASALGFIRNVKSLIILQKLVDDNDPEVKEAALGSRQRLLAVGV